QIKRYAQVLAPTPAFGEIPSAFMRERPPILAPGPTRDCPRARRSTARVPNRTLRRNALGPTHRTFGSARCSGRRVMAGPTALDLGTGSATRSPPRLMRWHAQPATGTVVAMYS